MGTSTNQGTTNANESGNATQLLNAQKPPLSKTIPLKNLKPQSLKMGISKDIPD
jgi:hypothetical protein